MWPRQNLDAQSNSFSKRTQGEAGPGLNPFREFREGGTTPTYPLAANQTKIPYPKHSNKTKLRLNESKKIL